MMFREGYYDFEGNTLYYESGDSLVSDLDSGELLPIEVLVVSSYLGESI